jgi:hypothetical protein
VLPAPSAACLDAWATDAMLRAISALPSAVSDPLLPISRTVADYSSTALAMVF